MALRLTVLPGAALWSGLYAAGGYFLATEWERVELMIRRLGWAGAAMAAAAAGAWWVSRRRRVRRRDVVPIVATGQDAEQRRAGARTAW